MKEKELKKVNQFYQTTEKRIPRPLDSKEGVLTVCKTCGKFLSKYLDHDPAILRNAEGKVYCSLHDNTCPFLRSIRRLDAMGQLEADLLDVNTGFKSNKTKRAEDCLPKEPRQYVQVYKSAKEKGE